MALPQSWNQSASAILVSFQSRFTIILFVVQIHEKRFFVYKYIESIICENNSESKIVEYIDGFTIIDNDLEHMFTHKFEYYSLSTT